MSSDLEWVALGEMIEYQKGYAFSSDEYSDTGCPIVRVSDFTADSINHQTEKAISLSLAQAYFRFALEEGDIVIATVGSWGTNPNSVVGKTIRVPKEVKGSLLNQNAVRIRAKNRKSQDFLFYSLKDKSFSDYIVACAQGSANQASITLSDIFRYEIADFSPDEHRARAAILRCIDDKIELNRKTNDTLEAMAKALFKSWFVDFDPVRAKAEGRPTGLPAEISDLFPDSFEDSELGEIPRGWSVGEIDQILNLQRDSLDPSCAPDEIFDHYSIPAFDAGKYPAKELGSSIKSQKFLVGDGDLLVSKLNPSTPRVWIPFASSGSRAICSTEFLVCRTSSVFGRAYAYCLASSDAIVEAMTGLAGGTSNSHQRIRPGDFLALPCCIGTEIVRSAFLDAVEPLLGKSLALRTESRSLSTTRDALLPKLISGEIRIPDAEKMLEEVGI